MLVLIVREDPILRSTDSTGVSPLSENCCTLSELMLSEAADIEMSVLLRDIVVFVESGVMLTDVRVSDPAQTEKSEVSSLFEEER